MAQVSPDGCTAGLGSYSRATSGRTRGDYRRRPWMPGVLITLKQTNLKERAICPKTKACIPVTRC